MGGRGAVRQGDGGAGSGVWGEGRVTKGVGGGV